MPLDASPPCRHAAKETCFVTATTERFVPGTLVALGSFLKHHPGFGGDLVVVHDALPEAHRRHLSQACRGVRFEPARPFQVFQAAAAIS